VIVPTKFEVFSPKAFVSYEGLENILADRSINVVMLRTLKEDVADSEILETDSIWQEIRDKLYTFALTHWKEVQKIYDLFPELEEIRARERELWKPILSLCSLDEETYKRVLSLAIEKTREKKTEDVLESREIILIRAMIALVGKDDFYKISDLKKLASEIEGDELKWMSPTWIGRTLANKFGFKEARRGIGKGRPHERRMSKEKVWEIARRYGLEPEEELEAIKASLAQSEGEPDLESSSLDDYSRHGSEEVIKNE
jgi:hypothetical protein